MSTLTTTQRQTNRGQKFALVVGYLALAGGILYAYSAPTTHYEISIYGSTPIGFWLGIAVAFVVAVGVTLSAADGYVSLAGLLLGGGGMVSLAGLPIIRNYFYYGSGDGLTHLGWTKDLFQGVMSAFGDFYPGVHTTALFIHAVLGTTIPRSLLLFVLFCVVAYLIFIPLCVRSMTSHRGAMLLGGLAGLLLLPINHLGLNYMTPHPISDAILLTPIIIYLLINYLTSPSDVFETRLPISAVGTVFAIVLGAIVLYHSQQAANLIIFFATISLVQFVYRVVRPGSRIAEHKTLYGPTVFLIGSFMVWSVGRSRYEDTVDAVIRELLSFLTGGANVGAGAATQGNSLAAAGGSVLELFLELFGVSLVFVVLAGLLMLTSLVGRLRDAPDTAALVKYFTVGLVVLIPYSLVFYVGSISELFFRNVGFIMLFATILGSIALYRYISGLSEVIPAGGVRAVTAVVVVVMIVLSAVIVFPSPYIFLPNNQVTEGQLSGYRFAFTHTDGDRSIYGLRQGPWRYQHGLFGVTGTDIVKGGQGIPEKNLTSLAGQTQSGRYLAITESMREREITVYNGVSYDQRNLSALDSQPGVSLVETNGEFDLYHIAGSGPASENATTPTANRTAGTNATTPTTTQTPTSTPTNGSIFGTTSAPTRRQSTRPPPTTTAPTAAATPPSTPATRTRRTATSRSIFGNTGRRPPNTTGTTPGVGRPGGAGGGGRSGRTTPGGGRGSTAGPGGAG